MDDWSDRVAHGRSFLVTTVGAMTPTIVTRRQGGVG
jgi:hypothetical protein